MFNNILSKLRIKIRRQKLFYLNNIEGMIQIRAKKEILISNIDKSNVGRIADFRSKKIVDLYSEFLREEKYGIYAWAESNVVGNAWATICRKPHCRGNGYLDMYRGEALIHHCNVSEEYRGQNIYPAMLVELCKRLFLDLGIKRIIIDTSVDNVSSLRGISKIGFKPLGIGVYIQFKYRFGEYLLFKHLKVQDKTITAVRKGFK